MKKSALIMLTIVASLAMSSCAVQNTQQSLLPDTLVDDTTHYVYNYPPPTYNYYYSNRFFDSFYRWFFPRRYYAVIYKPGYIPHHMRTDRGTASTHNKRTERSTGLTHRSATPTPTSKKRGGFGNRGSTHSVTS